MDRKLNLLALLIILAFFFLRLSLIPFPSSPMFDEVHYIKDAISFLEGKGFLRHEHPPLARLIITLNIFLLGNSPWGWRLFPLIASALSLFVFFLILRRVFPDRSLVLLSLLLLSSENLFFVQSGMAMLEPFFLLFMLVSFYFYLRERYGLSGLFLALSCLSKMTAVLGGLLLISHFLIKRWNGFKNAFFVSLRFLLPFSLFLPLLSLLSFELKNPISILLYMMRTHSSLTFSSTPTYIAAKPWEWFTSPLFYFYNPLYLGNISFSFSIILIPSFIYCLIRRGEILFFILWFLSLFASWIPIVLITDRLTFPFYIYPALPAISVMASKLILDLKRAQYVPKILRIASVSSFGIIHILSFYLMGPFSTLLG